jgi:hypothetical protein
MSIETQKVGLEPFYQGLGVIRYKTRKHEFTTLLKFICLMEIDSTYGKSAQGEQILTKFRYKADI